MGAHFSEAGLRFLRSLKRNNDRDWFNARKDTYERELKQPMLALIEEVNEAMLGFAPEHVRPPAKIMLRIYRDIRFSNDKRPYKSHISAWWARAGLPKTSGAGFYLQLSGTELLLAAGVYMPEREQLLALRRHLVTHHAAVRAELQSKRLAKLGFAPVSGNPLARPPKGFAAETAAMDLLVCREWGISSTLPAANALEPRFAQELIRRVKAAAPLVALLNEPLARPAARNAVVPFATF